MIKKIKKLCEKGNLSLLYNDENDTNSFLIGWIVAVGKDFFMIECVTSRGYHNGFTCCLIDSIIKIEENSKYVESIKKLWDLNNQKRINIPIHENACAASLIDYAIKNKHLCFIENCESAEFDSIGYIKSFDGEMISINRISLDCGEPDGEDSLNYNRISAITLGGEEQARLEKLSKS